MQVFSKPTEMDHANQRELYVICGLQKTNKQPNHQYTFNTMEISPSFFSHKSGNSIIKVVGSYRYTACIELFEWGKSIHYILCSCRWNHVAGFCRWNGPFSLASIWWVCDGSHPAMQEASQRGEWCHGTVWKMLGLVPLHLCWSVWRLCCTPEFPVLPSPRQCHGTVRLLFINYTIPSDVS